MKRVHLLKLIATLVVLACVERANADDEVRIELWRRLRGHENLVHEIEVSADGKRLYSLAEEGVVRIWNLDTGEQTSQLDTLSKMEINEPRMLVTADEQFLVLLSYEPVYFPESHLEIWNVQRKERVWSQTYPWSKQPADFTLRFSKRQTQLSFRMLERKETIDYEGQLKDRISIDLMSGRVRATVPQERRGDHVILDQSERYKIVWDKETKRIQVFDRENKRRHRSLEGTFDDCRARLTSAETLLVDSVTAGRLFLYGLPSGNLVRQVETKHHSLDHRNVNLQHSCFLSTTGSTQTGEISVRSTTTGTPLAHIRADRILKGHYLPVFFSPDGRFLVDATPKDLSIRVFKLSSQ